ncbi:MAG: alpha-methylacyl-CoA racemase, partial [Pseudonocardiales bacterium]|nr:alpha-methylacyl-CoA racemase [Pseudonocardiales bacterium]
MGPLDGVRIVEFAGLGPAPFCGMLLSDLGADVIRIVRAADVGLAEDRGSALSTYTTRTLARGRRSVGVDLKHPDGLAVALDLVAGADALVEGFRPGVMERLGLGPEVCLARNPALVYGRMTGWGQTGPEAHTAGHDIDYIALAGALAPLGRDGEPPQAPLNLVGDFGGGGLLLAFGIAAALVEAGRSGRGQVVDAAMVDGAALLMTMMYELLGHGVWEERRGANMIDGGAPFYATYATSDGGYMAVGALEPQFYA